MHHAILEEQDVILSLRLRCFLLKNGVDPRGVVFQQEKKEREEETGVLDPFLKDEEVKDVDENEEDLDVCLKFLSSTEPGLKWLPVHSAAQLLHPKSYKVDH